jgi:Protein of unknown function (DUF2490)
LKRRMTYYVKQLIPVILLMQVQPSFAQHHTNSWFKLYMTYRINGRLKVETELHHRRQNGFHNGNLLHNNLLNMGRVWLHYQANKNLLLSLSPFARFANYKVIQTKNDETLQPVMETRLTAAMAWQPPIASKWHLLSRSAIEYRLFKAPLADMVRLRQKWGLRYDISPKVNLSVYDELLANLPDKSTHTFYDHNRIGTVLLYKCNDHCQIDIGFIHSYRRQRNTDNYWQEENILLGLGFVL